MMSNWQLRQAARLLHAGGVIAYPTEAVYGIGCDPIQDDAVLRVLRLKQRPVPKGVILIAASLEQLAGFVCLESKMEARCRSTWPGPTTWVVPAGPRSGRLLTGGRDTLAVRVTAHPLAASLCQLFGGPLVSTSANLAGRPPARTALEVRARLPRDALDYVLSGSVGSSRRPTEIRHAASGAVIRQG